MRTMVEIARADQSIGILQKEISKKQKISIKYLDQIIHRLKSAGLIVNVGGKKSGYKLTKKASLITVLEVHYAFEPEIAVINCLSDKINCEMEEICSTYPFWKGLNEVVTDYFQNATVEDLVNGKEY